MYKELFAIASKMGLLDHFIADDPSLRHFLREIEGDADSKHLQSSVLESESAVTASEMLPIYKRRLNSLKDARPDNKLSILALIKFCEEHPDSLIKTATITSDIASYHLYYQVSSEPYVPICVIVGPPMPKDVQ